MNKKNLRILALTVPNNELPDVKVFFEDNGTLYEWLRTFSNCKDIERRKSFNPCSVLAKHRTDNKFTHSRNPYRWVADTISTMLEKKEYLGHTVNFKTYKQSYKSKKKLHNSEENQMIFENTHEAIIDIDIWERVQELRKNKRRPTRTGKSNMFSGIAYCADCGQKL